MAHERLITVYHEPEGIFVIESGQFQAGSASGYTTGPPGASGGASYFVGGMFAFLWNILSPSSVNLNGVFDDVVAPIPTSNESGKLVSIG